jgi:tRNA threonylcarbamoyladenosine modification (KEOPS) complex  Pcc1 subunit
VSRMIRLELRIEYPDKRTADAVHGAIGPENGDHVRAELRGNILDLVMESASAGSLKNTADDLLACIKAAEDASGLVVPCPAADLDGDAFLE